MSDLTDLTDASTSLLASVVALRDSFQTSRDSSEEWAIKAEDTLISITGGGDGTTDYSALHWAKKAEASAAAATVTTLAALDDVVETSVSDEEILQYDGGSNKWVNQTLNEAGISSSNHSHEISDTTGLQSALDGKVDDSQVLTDVPVGAVFTDTDTVYTHPANHSPSIINQDASNRFVSDAQISAWDAFGGGDVDGPGSSTDNAIAKYDLSTGKLLQNSGVLIDDANNVSGIGTLASGDYTIADGKITVTDTTNEEVLSITTSNTNQNTIVVTANSLTTGSAMYATCNTVFTGAGGFLNFDLANASATGPLMVLDNAGTGSGLFLNQDGNGYALEIDSESTTSNVVRIISANTTGNVFYQDMSSLTSGKGMFIKTNSSVFTGELMNLTVDHASATGTALKIQNDGTGRTFSIASNSSGFAIHSVSLNTTSTGNWFQQDSLTSGSGSYFYSNSSGMTGQVVNIYAPHSSNTGTALRVQNNSNSTGKGLYVETNYVTSGGYNTKFYGNSVFTGSEGFVQVHLDHASASGPALSVKNDGTGFGISSQTAGSNIPAIRLIHTHATAPRGVTFDFTGGAPDNNTAKFVVCNDTVAERLIIYSDGDVANHDGTYGTLSDRKLKTDITADNELRSYWEDIKSLKVRKYRMKTDIEQYGPDCDMRIGLVHDEVKEIFPGLAPQSPDTEEVIVGKRRIRRTKEVSGESVPVLDSEGKEIFEETDEDISEIRPVLDEAGNETSTGWVKSSIIEGPILLTVVQELMAKVESIEDQIVALKN